MADRIAPRRADYAWFRPVTPRWMDNDVYGHVNNAHYYSYFDTVVNRYLIEAGGLDIHAGPVVGFVVSSRLRLLPSGGLPGRPRGRTAGGSDRQELGPATGWRSSPPGTTPARAAGTVVHVFVDRGTSRPVEIPEPIRRALEAIARQEPAMTETRLHTCMLCEATCGIVAQVEGGRVTGIRGDRDDPFSRGHVCPKAAAIPDVMDHPDRIREPMRRVGDRWEPVSWEDALSEAADRISAIQREHGRNAVGMYVGNPTVHSHGAILGIPLLSKALGGRSRFSATSVDQLPQMLAALEMFGHQLLFPVPDVDRTDFFLVLGANPIVSNGSLMTAPGIADRLSALRARGGRLVVVDPRRTETAAVADRHVAVRPGGRRRAAPGHAPRDLRRRARAPRAAREVHRRARQAPRDRVALPSRARGAPGPASRRTRSARWPASSRPRPPRCATAASGSPRRSSAPSPRGS